MNVSHVEHFYVAKVHVVTQLQLPCLCDSLLYAFNYDLYKKCIECRRNREVFFVRNSAV